jgi:hypothetical protein
MSSLPFIFEPANGDESSRSQSSHKRVLSLSRSARRSSTPANRLPRIRMQQIMMNSRVRPPFLSSIFYENESDSVLIKKH